LIHPSVAINGLTFNRDSEKLCGQEIPGLSMINLLSTISIGVFTLEQYVALVDAGKLEAGLLRIVK
jgi:hypothetical protein